MPAQAEFQQRLKSIERLLGEIEAAADPNLRATAQELVQLVMDLHGAGLERMLELIRASDEGLVEKVGRDELVASLLILYGLHPVDLETRVQQTLDKARVRLRPHEGEVELLGIQEGVVRLRVHANGHGCGSKPEALREIVESAVMQGAPDVVSLLIEDPKPSLVQIGVLEGAAL
jgi:Fe-S cluster biogenesis protein NfuA